MKVLHICASDSGGAGIAARRLHLGLKLINIESRMLVLSRASSGADIEQYREKNFIHKKVAKKISAKLVDLEFRKYKSIRPEGLTIFSDYRTGYSVSRHPLVREADIVHLHWVAGMVDYADFFSNIGSKNIIWTLHDMNPFTGGCHYAGDCSKYKTACHSCPQLGAKRSSDLSKKIWNRKRGIYNGKKINIAAPSRWMADCARASSLFGNFKIDVIPYGLPTSIFSKRDTDFSRDLLNLPKDKTIILFTAHSAADPRKGLSYLVRSLKHLENKTHNYKFALAIVGRGAPAHLENIGFACYPIGPVQDELLMSICYSAADIFVSPSLEDNFPNTILESMACGTPVVGFNIGGVPEMVKAEETGFLAQAGDTEDLAKKIEWMVDHPAETKAMGNIASQLVRKEYFLEAQARKYCELYSGMLNGTKKHGE